MKKGVLIYFVFLNITFKDKVNVLSNNSNWKDIETEWENKDNIGKNFLLRR